MLPALEAFEVDSCRVLCGMPNFCEQLHPLAGDLLIYPPNIAMARKEGYDMQVSRQCGRLPDLQGSLVKEGSDVPRSAVQIPHAGRQLQVPLSSVQSNVSLPLPLLTPLLLQIKLLTIGNSGEALGEKDGGKWEQLAGSCGEGSQGQHGHREMGTWCM